MKHPTLAHFRHFSHFRHSTIITYFQTHSILTNKPNFRNDKMNINLDMTKDYEENADCSHEKTNPIQTQLKPIQSQFNPKQTQFNPIQTQFKPNSKPHSLKVYRPDEIFPSSANFLERRIRFPTPFFFSKRECQFFRAAYGQF